ncbi:MAG: Protein of unknown function precursor [Bacteroidetes bacterium]|nr:Protein of unknown function precursor [Bacteroidota bacterium]
MNTKHPILILTCVFTFLFSISSAQTSTNTSGGNGSGNGGTVSFTVGQVSYHTLKASNGSVAEGVQQPFEISVLSVLEEMDQILLHIQTYPNPTTDFLSLSISNMEITDLSYQLFDIQGKMVLNEKIHNALTSINMGDLVPSTYILKVIQNNKELKTFKIIKY